MSIDAIAESDAAAMTDDEMETLLEEAGVGVLALSTDDLPYVLPMSFGYDGAATLYFVYLLFGTESRKETLTDRAGRARFVTFRAESMHEWRSVSLTGDVTAIDEGEWEALTETMDNAWHSDLFGSARPMRGVEGYRLDAEEWNGIQYGVVED